MIDPEPRHRQRQVITMSMIVRYGIVLFSAVRALWCVQSVVAVAHTQSWNSVAQRPVIEFRRLQAGGVLHKRGSVSGGGRSPGVVRD